MITRRNLVLSAFASLVPTPIIAQSAPQMIQAPFGLQWGSSPDEIIAKGIVLQKYSDENDEISFHANELQSEFSDQKGVGLRFGHNNKLRNIIVLGPDYPNDPQGKLTRKRYFEIYQTLKANYGEPENNHRLGKSMYSDPAYFLAGIRRGETEWWSSFNTIDLNIILCISASDASTGTWTIYYDYLPLRKVFDTFERARGR